MIAALNQTMDLDEKGTTGTSVPNCGPFLCVYELDRDPIGVAESQDARFVGRRDHCGTDLRQAGSHGISIVRRHLDPEVLDVRLAASGRLLETETRLADSKPDARGARLATRFFAVENPIELRALLEVGHVKQHVIDALRC